MILLQVVLFLRIVLKPTKLRTASLLKKLRTNAIFFPIVSKVISQRRTGGTGSGGGGGGGGGGYVFIVGF